LLYKVCRNHVLMLPISERKKNGQSINTYASIECILFVHAFKLVKMICNVQFWGFVFIVVCDMYIYIICMVSVALCIMYNIYLYRPLVLFMQSQPQLANTKVWVGNARVHDTGKQLLRNHALNFLKIDLSTFLVHMVYWNRYLTNQCIKAVRKLWTVYYICLYTKAVPTKSSEANATNAKKLKLLFVNFRLISFKMN
jgi:hypothetical protein